MNKEFIISTPTIVYPPGAQPLFSIQIVILNQKYPALSYLRFKKQRIVLTLQPLPITAAKPKKYKKLKVYQPTSHSGMKIHKN